MDAPLYASLPASDLQRAMAWYADKLDLKPVDENEGAVWYESGGSRFLVYQSQFAGSNQATAAGFAVDDFDAALSMLRDRGVTLENFDLGPDLATEDGVVTLPDGSKAAWFKDSEGNILAVSNG